MCVCVCVALADVELQLRMLLLVVVSFFFLSLARSRSWPVYDGVPPNVSCTPRLACWNFSVPHFDNVCARVCERGSVVVPPWLAGSLRVQLALSRTRGVCWQQWAGSHNSAISLADGYGVLDGLLTHYAGSTVRTADQVLSLTDQLNLGVRLLELDTHFVLGELRIAHCGGRHIGFVDAFVKLLDAAARLLGLPPIPWDSTDIGCFPSGSSIPADRQRPLAAAYAEVAAWLAEHPTEFIMLYHDDEPEMEEFKKVHLLVAEARAAFGDLILRPSVFNASVPVATWVQRGWRVMLHSRTDYGRDMQDVFFATKSICNWTEPDLKQVDTKTCTVLGVPTMRGVLFRPETTWLTYGPFGGEDKLRLTPATLPPIVRCGINIPSPDAITPATLAAQVWSFEDGADVDGALCALMGPSSPRWRAETSAAVCGSLPVAAPTNGRENTLLWERLKQSGQTVVVWSRTK